MKKIAILSDIHGNIIALEKVVERENSKSLIYMQISQPN